MRVALCFSSRESPRGGGAFLFQRLQRGAFKEKGLIRDAYSKFDLERRGLSEKEGGLMEAKKESFYRYISGKKKSKTWYLLSLARCSRLIVSKSLHSSSIIQALCLILMKLLDDTIQFRSLWIQYFMSVYSSSIIVAWRQREVDHGENRF